MSTALVSSIICATFALLFLLRREELRPLAAPVGVRPYALPAPASVPGPAVVAMAASEPARPAAAPPPPAEVEDAELEAWRREQLLALGLDAAAAERAVRAGVDASRVRSLVERGCTPELALRILL